jgi:hypothetical protein
MERDWIAVQQVTLADGVNSSFKPDLIGTNQAAWMVNAGVREGKPHTRPGLTNLGVLPAGKVQGVGHLSNDGGVFVLSIDGQLWKLQPYTSSIEVDPIPLAWPNSNALTEAWFCETAGTLVVQDGQSCPIFYDGSSTRRSDLRANEVPIGRQMAYGNGRLWVAINGRQLVAGDITQDIYQSELFFTETQYLSGGGAFYYPRNITGLAFLPINDTATGYGSLLVGMNNGIHALKAEVTSRDLWQQMPGFEVTILPEVGPVGQNTLVQVNQDVYWRDVRGQIWSLRSAIVDAQGPGNSPLSREVQRVVDFETKQLLPQSSGVYFDNRIFFLAAPIYNIYGTASFQKIVSLDVAPVATMRGKTSPAYDGEWGGLNFTRLFSGVINGENRAFAISLDADGENRLWEFNPAERRDYTLLAAGTSLISTASEVQGTIEYRRFDFGLPGQKKRLMRCDLWPTDIDGPVTLKVYWRTDNRTQWYLWDTVSFAATMTNADNAWLNLEAQERGRVKTLSAPTLTDALEQVAADVGYGFQIKLVWTGSLLIDRIQIWAKPLEESAYSENSDLSAAALRNSVTNTEIPYTVPVGGLGDSYVDQDDDAYVNSFGVVYRTTL